MVRSLSLAVVLAVFWLLLSGIYDALLLGLGVMTVVLTVYAARRFGTLDNEGHPVEFLIPSLSYYPWLLKEIAVSSYGVGKLILFNPSGIAPRVIEVDATQRSRTGVAYFANSITLTPGTVTLDVNDNRIQVHALTAGTAADLQAGEMDRRVSGLEVTS